MNLPRRFRRAFASSLVALCPVVAFGHPGHDGDHGDGLTWDFAADVLHRLTSPYHLAPVLAAAALGVIALRLISARKNRASVRHEDRRRS